MYILECFNNRVECYIEYGWHEYVIDPDGGINCLRKLTSSNRPGSESYKLLQSMPSKEDMERTNKLNRYPPSLLVQYMTSLLVAKFS